MVRLAVLLVFAISLVSAVSVAPAKADLLFLDLNDGSKEVAEAQAVARWQTHERVFVYPTYSASERSRIRAQGFQLEARQQNYEYLVKHGAPAQAARAGQAVEAASLEFRQALGEGFTLAGLDRFLTQAEQNGADLSALVISGHHGTDDYWGLFTKGTGVGTDEFHYIRTLEMLEMILRRHQLDRYGTKVSLKRNFRS
jgi:hypothetical protein